MVLIVAAIGSWQQPGTMLDFDTPIAASNFAPRNYVPPNYNMSCNYNNCYEPPAYENQPRELTITLDINF